MAQYQGDVRIIRFVSTVQVDVGQSKRLLWEETV